MKTDDATAARTRAKPVHVAHVPLVAVKVDDDTATADEIAAGWAQARKLTDAERANLAQRTQAECRDRENAERERGLPKATADEFAGRSKGTTRTLPAQAATRKRFYALDDLRIIESHFIAANEPAPKGCQTIEIPTPDRLTSVRVALPKGERVRRGRDVLFVLDDGRIARPPKHPGSLRPTWAPGGIICVENFGDAQLIEWQMQRAETHAELKTWADKELRRQRAATIGRANKGKEHPGRIDNRKRDRMIVEQCINVRDRLYIAPGNTAPKCPRNAAEFYRIVAKLLAPIPPPPGTSWPKSANALTTIADAAGAGYEAMRSRIGARRRGRA